MKAEKEESSAGFFLIETIVAICIIGLLVTGFFSLLAYCYAGIRSAGLKDQIIYQMQQQTDNALQQDPTSGSDSLSINFSYANESLSISGQKQEIDSSSTSFPFSITIFKPYKV